MLTGNKMHELLRIWDGLYLEVKWAFVRGTTVPSEIFSAALLLWFAFAIGRPDPLRIDVLTVSPLDEYAPLQLVGAGLAVIQIWRLIAIGLQQRRVRMFCALFSVFWWTMFAIGFTVEFPGVTIRFGSGVTLAILQSWVAIRMSTGRSTDHEESAASLVKGVSGGFTD